MPGMMDTILNLGLNDETVQGLEALTGGSPFRPGLLPSFYPDVLRCGAGISFIGLNRVIESKKEELGIQSDIEVSAEDWGSVIESFKQIVREETGEPFPQDPDEPAVPVDPRCVRFLEQPTSPNLPQDTPDP